MPLLVTVRKSPEAIAITGSSKTFEAQGGTMGRGAANTWILDDPERYLSSTHCQFSSEGGQFYISDLSTNGTFLNGSTSAMGKGTRQPLNEGDIFALGDYEFSVSLSDQPSAGEAPYSGPFVDSQPEDYPPSGGGTPFVKSLPDEGPVQDPNKASGLYPGFGENSSGGFPRAQSGQSIPDGGDWGWGDDTPGGLGGGADNDGVLGHNIDLPGVKLDETPFAGGGSTIPENWDSDLPESQPSMLPAGDPSSGFYTPPIEDPWKTPDVQPEISPGGRKTGQIPATFTEPDKGVDIGPDIGPDIGKVPDGSVSATEYQALVDLNAQLQTELDMLKRTQSSPGSDGYSVAGVSDTGLLEAMGFQIDELSEEEKTRISSQVGAVVREMIIGLMKVLGARSTIKNEFRMNVTTIQPVENNPLKFSANINDALENMFIKQGNAYIQPLEAVREGFNGIAEHQVAILAGMRAAFKGVIERFDPEMLSERFSRQQKGSIFTISQDAKNWDAYLEYYKNLAGDTDNSFQSLFGDEFVSAYEEQLQKLSFARKSLG